LFLLLGLSILPVGAYFSLFHEGVDLKGLVATILFSCAWSYFGLLALRMRVEIDREEFRVRGALLEKRIPHQEIAGFNVQQQGVVQRIRLLDEQGQVLATISSWIAQYAAIRTMLERRFQAPQSATPIAYQDHR